MGKTWREILADAIVYAKTELDGQQKCKSDLYYAVVRAVCDYIKDNTGYDAYNHTPYGEGNTTLKKIRLAKNIDIHLEVLLKKGGKAGRYHKEQLYELKDIVVPDYVDGWYPKVTIADVLVYQDMQDREARQKKVDKIPALVQQFETLANTIINQMKNDQETDRWEVDKLVRLAKEYNEVLELKTQGICEEDE